MVLINIAAWYDASCSSYDERTSVHAVLFFEISLRARVSSPGGQWGREEKRIYKLDQKIDVNDSLRSISISPAFITLGANKQANQLIAGGYQA